MITIDPRVAPDRVKAWLDMARPEIDADMERRLVAAEGDPGRLVEGMRYAALGPGKRLRPALALAACQAVSGDRSAALPVASALEMLHAYTLVHDDLPAMDDDDMRRGRPTVHVVFGEAIAILVGDGLLTAAFGALADLGPRAADAVAVLARRAGALELLRGQAVDMATSAGDQPVAFDDLERLHVLKTGALFSAAAELGGIAGGASDEQRRALGRYGLAIGVAFQHADDRDDRDHRDHAERAAARMKELTGQAADIARSFGEQGEPLLAVATWIGAVA
jgi:geranylgeranyl pyrophosphate synthase